MSLFWIFSATFRLQHALLLFFLQSLNGPQNHKTETEHMCMISPFHLSFFQATSQLLFPDALPSRLEPGHSLQTLKSEFQ